MTFRPRGVDPETSTERLVQLCGGYFFFYVLTGIAVKYFLGSEEAGLPAMSDLEFLIYSTLGSNLLCLGWIAARGWHRIRSNRTFRLGPWQLPEELKLIVPSGICTAVVIPATTLMYTLPISVMVAMVIMRGSVIVISRMVDAIQIRQGLMKRRVYGEENFAVLFSIAAVGVHLVSGLGSEEFAFFRSGPAMAILGSYVLAYAVRIYLMNFFKNTRPKGASLDNRGFFAVEQIAATGSLVLASAAILLAPVLFGVTGPRISAFSNAIFAPHPDALAAMGAGLAYGAVAFFSVFLFMFGGRTATFAGLVNRLTSLVAGTAATLAFAGFFGGKLPKFQDWISLALILVAVACLSRAERRRTRELELAREAEEPRRVSLLAGAPVSRPAWQPGAREPRGKHENPVRL